MREKIDKKGDYSNIKERRYVFETVRKVPILLDVDIAIAGAGFAGTMAAIAAARQGLRVVLIERFGAIGGNMTIGLVTKPSGVLLGGIPLELWEKAEKIGAAGVGYTANIGKTKIKLTSPIDSEMAKILLTNMCIDAGVQILFECNAVAPIMENNLVKGIIIESKGGREAILSNVVIDCTADADIATRGGAPFESNDKLIGVTIMFKVNRVNTKKFAQWIRTHPEHAPSNYVSSNENLEYGIYMTGLMNLLKEFQKNTGLNLYRPCINFKNAKGEEEVLCNATGLGGVATISTLDRSKAITELYLQIEILMTFYKEYIPGFENCYINGISPMLGTRESRHILGEYFLTGKDVMEGTHFEDSIGVDISVMDNYEFRDTPEIRWEKYPAYEIPYRCLVPKKIDQILVAGRCISNDHSAHGRLRNIPACMSTGQAAGFAAAVAAKTHKSVRNIEVTKVQKLLKEIGMPVYKSEIH